MNRRWKWATLGGVTMLVLAGAAVMYRFNPAEYGFYPVCLFHKMTGLLCPGCGSLRAMHRLLHGDVAEAFRLNALFVISLPLGIWIALREIISVVWGKKLPGPSLRPLWGWLLLVAVFIFGILRNIL